MDRYHTALTTFPAAEQRRFRGRPLPFGPHTRDFCREQGLVLKITKSSWVAISINWCLSEIGERGNAFCVFCTFVFFFANVCVFIFRVFFFNILQRFARTVLSAPPPRLYVVPGSG